VSDSVAVLRAEHITTRRTTRLLSLDVFRGITIAAMILVNNPGNAFGYWPLEHAEWNGWTPTDLIFPFFIFIAGVSLVLSFASRIERGATRSELLRHSLRRAAIIFAIGVGLNSFPYYHVMPIRLPGVLQRIAIAYAFAAIVALWTKTRGRIIAVLALLAGYWALMRFVPVPGFGLPGRDIPFMDPDRNLAAWLDRLIIPGRLYNVTHDPEGILSTLPAIATALLGVLTGEWLRSERRPNEKVTGMLLFGVAGLIAGKIFDIFLMPINKNLWTSSFVVFTAGFALVLLAACYWALDVKGWRGPWATPFVAFGMNAIGIYTLASLVAKTLNDIHIFFNGEQVNLHDYINMRFYERMAGASMASLLYSLTVVLASTLVVYVAYRKKFFLKV
jgi:predicted acyltransferase